jgi:hypothetical protein
MNPQIERLTKCCENCANHFQNGKACISEEPCNGGSHWKREVDREPEEHTEPAVISVLIAWEQFKKANWYESEAVDVEAMLMEKFQAIYYR